MKFVKYHATLQKDPNTIMVDGHNVAGTNLSHWKNAGTLPQHQADTSAESALKFLVENQEVPKNAQITATHFDIDGFTGVWSLLNPTVATNYYEVLKRLATIGDFREWSLNYDADEHALKLAAWLNQVEKKFYVPFGKKDEIEACMAKFEYFLPLFEQVITHTEQYEKDWIQEYSQVKNDFERLQQKGKVKHYPEIGLSVIYAPHPLHYYALFSATEGYDCVLSLYENNYYELEYKYLTWVDIVSRPVFPRVSLKPLVNFLNKNEQNGTWVADNITDTGPQMHIRPEKMNKAQRFEHPCNRNFVASSWQPEKLEEIVVQFFQQNYAQITPKNHWTWAEMSSLPTKFQPN
jgi:hypothetical protein